MTPGAYYYPFSAVFPRRCSCGASPRPPAADPDPLCVLGWKTQACRGGGRGLCSATLHHASLRPSLASRRPGTRLAVAGKDLGPRRSLWAATGLASRWPARLPGPSRIPLFWRGGPRGAEAPLRRPPGGRRAWGAARRGGAAAERGGGLQCRVRCAALAREPGGLRRRAGVPPGRRLRR